MACQYSFLSPFSFQPGTKYKQSLWSENISWCSTYCLFVAIHQDDAVEQSKERIQVSQWDWHYDSNGTGISYGGAHCCGPWKRPPIAHVVIQHKILWQNTTHCSTVQFLHQNCWGLGLSLLRCRPAKMSCCCLYTSMTTVLIYSMIWINLSYRQIIRQFMVW